MPRQIDDAERRARDAFRADLESRRDEMVAEFAAKCGRDPATMELVVWEDSLGLFWKIQPRRPPGWPWATGAVADDPGADPGGPPDEASGR